MRRILSAKGIANAAINRLNRSAIQVRLACQYGFGLLGQYQPNPFGERVKERSSARECWDRLEAFEEILPDAPFSFMDLGCNTGFFVFRLAELGGFGLGIDSGRNEIMVCQTLATLHEIENVAFWKLSLTPATVVSLPRVDVVVFLSLFHHLVRHYGEKEAMGMLSTIATKADRFLVFETGQPNEDSSWARELRFMGEDPVTWSEGTLRSYGFDQVHRLGEYGTSISNVKRHLLVGERRLPR